MSQDPRTGDEHRPHLTAIPQRSPAAPHPESLALPGNRQLPGAVTSVVTVPSAESVAPQARQQISAVPQSSTAGEE
ncbi:hypothetical protein ABT095_01725 [Kitasatospora sp. NPDC002227]|uniref:hypothetical protein n=1 Tax=Kitasatospora sp. NPDC002227 TaxID=3154773 RepID=UPI00331E097E